MAMKEVSCKRCQGWGEYLVKEDWEDAEVKNQTCEYCHGKGYTINRGDYEFKGHSLSKAFKRVWFGYWDR